VNYTAGLVKSELLQITVRYDIAGKGIADHNSFKEAVYLALDIYRSRIEYAEISQKPLEEINNTK
jgi:4-hydroxythreonine-4-phosphate dehydrogenase